jgi:hypothetical protein
MNRYVLTLDLEFYWQRANLDHLTDIETDRKRNLVAALVNVPVHEHAGRNPDSPPISGQVNEKVLKVQRPSVFRIARGPRRTLHYCANGRVQSCDSPFLRHQFTSDYSRRPGFIVLSGERTKEHCKYA